MKHFIKRLATLLLCTVLGMILPYGTVNASTPGDKALGIGAITNPTQGSWNKVYFGSKKTPILFNVLQVNETHFGGNTMLLDCAEVLTFIFFDEDGEPNECADRANDWSHSDIKDWLNGDTAGKFKYDRFTDAEISSIAESRKAEAATGYDGDGWNGTLGWAPLNGEKIFFLDAAEATNTAYGFENTHEGSETRLKKESSELSSYDRATVWWLRSPHSNDNKKIGYVSGGVNGMIYYFPVNIDYGVSPALNIKQSSVLFSSEISSGSKTYKLTIADPGRRTIGIQAGKKTTRDSTSTITVPYDIDSDSDHVSLLITNAVNETGDEITWSESNGWSSGAVKQYYTTATVNSAKGSVTLTLPDNYETGKGNWKVWLLSEQVHEGNATDYASAPCPITIPDWTPAENETNDTKETAAVRKAPTAKTMTYNGEAQELVVAGEAAGGTMLYALGTKNAATETFSTAIPKATDVGSYTVWYYVKGDANHLDTKPESLTVTINKPKPGDDTKADEQEMMISAKTTTADGKTVTVTLKTTYLDAVSYTGSKITKAQLKADIDLKDLASKFQTHKKGYTPLNLLKAAIVTNDKKAGAASFYVRITFDKKKAKKAKMSKQEIRNVQAMVYALNEEAAKEENRCLFRIVPISLKASTVALKATWKKNKPAIKSVKVTIKVNGKKKTVTLKKNSDYKIVSYDSKAKTVTLKGCGNFEDETTKSTKK